MVVILDPQNSGISGNMVVGALIDIGANKEMALEVMEHYGSYFGDVNVKIEKVQKSGISASYVNVTASDKRAITYNELMETLDKIEYKNMDNNVLKFAKNVFRTLGIAEAKVHGTTLDRVHFHEVGAADAVADVIGASYCFYDLDFNRKKVYGMPIALGGGRIKSEHGNLSVPAPATLEILKNFPVFGGPEEKELATPTGAALYVNMIDEPCNFYPMISNKKVGYGAGKLDLFTPNVLRIIEGDSGIQTDKVTILETNLDNVTGEVIGHTFDKLMDAGALDVAVVPIIMKKNRPGHLLRVISRTSDHNKVSEAIIRETGTLGVRVIPYVHRNIVEREIKTIKINIDETESIINIKVGKIGEDIINYSPEYEDAKRIALETGIPLKDVMKRANETFKKLMDRKEI
ncbi:nickel pincer cofactor biosynthesis protein LarC [Methanobacterium sp. ACI-7]|uniref:nickel pincer cofactor biosynthesis protein LarC n=1 Tax=unclassified Methanobacterium TaxID=2627676 RepID=UPI0039C22ECE